MNQLLARPEMKRIIWAAPVAVVLLALLAGKDDICRLHRMRQM
jgi:hypothetical protein